LSIKKRDTFPLAGIGFGSLSATSSNLHSAAKVGLSTSAHGYSAIVNLAHAVFLLCFLAMLSFLYTTGGGYSVQAPPGLEEWHVQAHLDKAGWVVTVRMEQTEETLSRRHVLEPKTTIICQDRLGTSR
jgi:hypothetical protein